MDPEVKVEGEEVVVSPEVVVEETAAPEVTEEAPAEEVTPEVAA